MFSSRNALIRLFQHYMCPMCRCSKRCYAENRPNKHDRKQSTRREHSIPTPLVQGDLLHGIHPVTAAIQRQHRQIYGAFFKADTNNHRIKEIWRMCEDRRISTLEVTGHVMDHMTEYRPHQGVCLDVSPLRCDTLKESDIRVDGLVTEDQKPALWLLPFQIKDAMNMGAILRSAFFFGVQHILLPHKNSAELSSVVSKASSGALEMLTLKQFISGTHLFDTLQRWKDTGGLVVGSSSDPNTDKGLPVNKFKMEKPTLLIIGNERYGLPGHITNRCDVLLHIEGLCKDTDSTGNFSIDSLNVSAATAVLLYSVLNSR